MITPNFSDDCPKFRRATLLCDSHLRVIWSDAPCRQNVPPWDFAGGPYVDAVQTAFARCLAGIDVSPFDAGFDLEGPLLFYRVQLHRIPCEQLPVVAICHWMDHRLQLLTPREDEVMKFTAQGLNTRQIAEQLGISPSTIDTHRSRLKAKLNLSSIAALGHFAAQNCEVAE